VLLPVFYYGFLSFPWADSNDKWCLGTVGPDPTPLLVFHAGEIALVIGSANEQGTTITER